MKGKQNTTSDLKYTTEHFVCENIYPMKESFSIKRIVVLQIDINDVLNHKHL